MKPTILTIGDLHISDKRRLAFETSSNSLFANCKPKTKFNYGVITGDIFNKYPNIKERLMFAEFIKRLQEVTEKIVLIKGTDSHDYSSAIYNLEDIIQLTTITAENRFKLDNFLFVHEPIKGAKYDNGIEEQNGLDIATISEKIIAGHYHTKAEKDNLIIVGSIYKTTFAQKDDTKRILIIKGDKIKSIPIDSRPMYMVHLTGQTGKVGCDELALLKSLPKDSEIDLKIVVTTDSQTLPSVHSNIAKIKNKFHIEYYQEEITINRIKSDVPKNLNEEELLKVYCKKQNTDFTLVQKEFKK